MQLLTTLLAALALAASATAEPIHAAKRDDAKVISPPITSPHEGERWKVGSNQTVKWDTSGIPQNGKVEKGSILLGYYDKSGVENLAYTPSGRPLASDFSLTAGSHQITVPHVPYGDHYFVVLLGYFDNKSPDFTIF